MPKKLIIAILVLCVLALLGGIGGIAGYFWLKEHRTQQALTQGDASFAKGDFNDARRQYATYLRVYRQDLDVLTKFADSCAKVKENRPRILRDIMLSYNQIALKRVGDVDAVKKLIDHCERTHSWTDLEYYSDYYGKQLPDLEWLHYEHALALDRLNRSQEAMNAFDALIKEKTLHADVYGRQARLLTDLGLGTRAEELFDEVFKQKPEDPALLAQRALYRLTQNDIVRAQEDIDKSLSLAPELGTTQMVAARIALRQTQWDKAIQYAQGALDRGEEPQQAYVLLISAHQEQSGFAAALKVMESMDPMVRLDSPDLLLVHHELLLGLSQMDKAKAVRLEFTVAYPNNPQFGEYMQAREMLASGEPAAAADKLVTISESLPSFRQARYYLAVALIQSFQQERAKTVLELFIRTFPGDVHAQALYDREFGGVRKDATTVAASAKELLAKEDSTAAALVQSAQSLFDAQQSLDKAAPALGTVQTLLDKALKQDPKYPNTYLVYADFHLRRGDPAEAKAFLERGVQACGTLDGSEMVQAWIALAENNEQGALDAFQTQLNQVDLTSNTVRRWANSFAARGHIETALALLALGSKKLPAEKAADLFADPVSLCIRFGDYDRAQKELETLEAQAVPNGGTVDPRILSSKEQLAQLLARSSTPRQTAEAKKLVEQLLQVASGEKRYKLLMAEVLSRQTPPDFAGSKTILDQALEVNANDVAVLQAQASIAMLQNDVSKALDFARHAASVAPQDSVVGMGLAKIQLAGQQYGEAQATLEQVLMTTPNDPQALELLITAYMANGRLDQANSIIQRMEKVANSDPGMAWRVSLLKGRLSAARGENLGNVEAMLRTRYVANPNDLESLRSLAEVVARQGRDAEAEQLLQGFADSHPNSEDALVLLGQYFLAKNTPEASTRASVAFTKALVAHPDYASALRGLMDLYLRSNSLAQVLQLCERYLSIHPATPEILYKKALLQLQMNKDRDGAMATIEQAIALSKEPEYLYFRGMLQLDAGKNQEALTDFQEAGKIRDVNSADLDMGMAEAYAALNDPEPSARYLDSAKRKLDNGAPGNKERLDRLLKRIAQEGEGK